MPRAVTVPAAAAAALIAIFAPACSDAPYAPPECDAHEVVSGHLCLTRTADALTPGADQAGWDALAVTTWAGCTACSPGSVIAFAAAPDPSGAVLVRGYTLGPPIVDGTVRYAVETRGVGLEGFPDVMHVLGWGLLYRGGTTWRFLGGGPDVFAFTADGFEARLPPEVLPFDAEFWVEAMTATPDDPANPSSFALSYGKSQLICWDASAEKNLCSPLP